MCFRMHAIGTAPKAHVGQLNLPRSSALGKVHNGEIEHPAHISPNVVAIDEIGQRWHWHLAVGLGIAVGCTRA